MGKGIWYRRDNRRHVIIDSGSFRADWTEETQGDWECDWECMEDDVRSCLSDSFWTCSDWEGRDVHVIARNRHFSVALSEDDCGGAHVLFSADDDNPLAMANLDRAAEAFFDRLEKLFPLRVATSAWTSGPRRAA